MSYTLIITVKQKGKAIATICHDYCVFTQEALDKTQRFVHFLESAKNKGMDPRLACVRYCEQRGGGTDELSYVQTLFPEEVFETDIACEMGCVHLSEQGMLMHHAWGDLAIDIDLDARMVENHMMWTHPVFDIEGSWMSEIENKRENAITTNIDVENFSFDDVDEVSKIVYRAFFEDGIIESCGCVCEMVAL